MEGKRFRYHHRVVRQTFLHCVNGEKSLLDDPNIFAITLRNNAHYLITFNNYFPQEDEAKQNKSKTKEEVKTALFTDPKPEPIKSEETVSCDQSSQNQSVKASEEDGGRRSLRPRNKGSAEVKEGKTENGASLNESELIDVEGIDQSETVKSASNVHKSETVTETSEDQLESTADQPMEVDVTNESQQKVSLQGDSSGSLSSASTSATETASEVGTDPNSSKESVAMVSVTSSSL